MASIPRFLFLALLFHAVLLVKCDEEDDLLQGINQYRRTFNLPALTKNERVECLAEEVADSFKGQPCNNTSGPNGAPGTEPRISAYPNILTKCRLNATTVQDGLILPACVPSLQAAPLLSNYTRSRYASFLNDTRFSGIGIGSEDDWTVIVLTTSTPNGTLSPGSGTPGNGPSTPGSNNPGNGAPGLASISPIMLLLIGLFVLV